MTEDNSQLPRRVAAVLFDMDNTLVASEDSWFAATRQLWEDAGADATGKEILGGTVGDVAAAFVADFPDADSAAVERDLTATLAANLTNDGVHPTDGAVELIERLSAKLPITIASNSPTSIVEQVVATLGWGHLFTAALGTEDVARPKPAPDLYTTAAQRCNADITQCVIFEDSPMGAESAVASGAFVVTIGPEAAHLGNLNVPHLTDPRIVDWNPEAIA
ncbi:HAD family hydrolase [Tessaracoccus massiliensis]|uniref:HAD family hydrolase n=1 Tax=Tessaracoccus massiliensis TaxID=1522311 RepID=UPI00058CC0A2|nr:HAD family phosphatase [Tessaracoccus massiliensis]